MDDRVEQGVSTDYRPPSVADGTVAQQLIDSLSTLADSYGAKGVLDTLLQLHPGLAEDRTSVLGEAQGIIHGARQSDYGSPAQSFGRIAALWSVYLGTEMNEYDVAMLMTLLKVSRSKNGIDAHGKPQRDSLVDIAGYVGCCELVEEELNDDDR